MKKKFYLFGLLAGIMFGMVGFASCCCPDDGSLSPEPAPAPAPEPIPDPYAEMVKTPLTLEAIADGTITFSNNAAGAVTYTVDGGALQTIAAGASGDISVTAGQKVAFFGDNATYTDANDNYSYVSSTADFYAYGNVMSLVSSTDYANVTTLTEDGAFKGLFEYNTFLKSHPTNPLVLPATTLTDECYYGMFRDCTGLTSAPALPAPALEFGCYHYMFKNCTGLTSAPALPATTLAGNCYGGMFSGCTSLTSAPALPAMTLAMDCYSNMFAGCTGLTSAPALPATTLAEGCYEMMFQGCTSLTSAPDLLATTLVKNCYLQMFFHCTKLNYVKCMATDMSAENCTGNWLYYVASTGTFVQKAGVNWSTGNPSGIPSGWQVQSE